MKRYGKYIKPYLSAFILGPVMMIVEVIGEVMLPAMMADIINVGAANRDIGYIISKGLMMAAIAFVMMAGGIGGAYFAVKAAMHFGRDLRGDLFRKVQPFSFANIDGFSAGSLVTRLTNDITQMQNVIMMGLRMMLRAPGMLIGAVIMAFMMNLKLAVIILIVIPLLLGTIILILKTFIQLVCQRHRTVFSPGTANRHHKLILPLQHIVRYQKPDHIIQLVQKNMRHLISHDKILNRPVIAGQLPKLFIIIRVGKKAYIKYKIRIAWYPIFEAKGHYGNHQIFKFPVLHKYLVQLLLKLPYQELACVDNIIRMLFKKYQAFSLQRNSLLYPAGLCQRMHSPCFFIAFYQHLVTGIQEQNLIWYPLARKLFQNLFQTA